MTVGSWLAATARLLFPVSAGVEETACPLTVAGAAPESERHRSSPSLTGIPKFCADERTVASIRQICTTMSIHDNGEC